MRKLLCLLLALFSLCPLFALAEDEPLPWDYAIDPLTLRNLNGYLTLANRDHLLASAYAPSDLVNVTARHVSGRFQLRQAAHDALLAMFAAADADGCTLYVKSAYRSYQTQNTMYYNRLKANNGKDDGWVSYPGASDHQTGLGLDILNYAWTQKSGMNAEFANTKEAQWMAAHCHEYGFVIRYQQDKQEITGINFEPWHLRYVGPSCAAYMYENNLSLEEFTLEWQAYIANYNARGGNYEEYCKALTTLPDPVVTGSYDGQGDGEMSFFQP
ncbi:MAG: M15 family metallopeptidase [Clostridia bacterium]|nr:M15 family metallopeptidase [Clostridia bacterium]